MERQANVVIPTRGSSGLRFHGTGAELEIEQLVRALTGSTLQSLLVLTKGTAQSPGVLGKEVLLPFLATSLSPVSSKMLCCGTHCISSVLRNHLAQGVADRVTLGCGWVSWGCPECRAEKG